MHVFETLRGRTRLRLRATPGDLAFEGLSTFIALAVVGLLVLITVILYLAAAESIRTYGLGFLSGGVWDSVSQRFGAAPFVYGMLVTSALALLLGVPVSLGIAIFPTISALSREALLAVPDSQREAALSLGATRWETTRLGVLRYARAGIFGAAILGLGRAVGETMAVTMTIGNRAAFFGSLFEPGQTIASQIASRWLDAVPPLELGALIQLGLVLMLVSLFINLFARLMVGRFLRVGEGAE